jgi:hypothetical protein
MSQGLPLLDVDRPPGARGGDEQIGLAAKKRRNLQHIDRLRRDRALVDFVNVGQHGQAQRLANFREDRQRRLQPDAPLAAARGAIGLVERGLEDQPDSAPLRDLLQRRRHFERVRAAFELAGSSD